MKPGNPASGRRAALYGKILIRATLRLETGLHIGASSDFAPIGAVDASFVRDPVTQQPVIPGSSLKGKLRTLLARSLQEGDWLPPAADDPVELQRLFGNAAFAGDYHAARLQFSDLRMTEASFRKFDALDLDTYIGEIKFENAINRLSAIANPRQVERVPAGAEFGMLLVYNVEQPGEVLADMQLLADGLRLLRMDYLGGSGSRGYGRVSFRDFRTEAFALQKEREEAIAACLEDVRRILDGCRL